MLQEVHPDRTHTYIYTEADSYEPLAQITNYTDPDKAQQIHYFHCDQIGIPREMSDEAGNIVWRGQYDAWGKLLHEEKADGIHQPFRLQNQYDDPETGLHYNFFRYYDPTVGRFTQQDPIGLAGGMNVYRFAPNVQMWVDPLGLHNRETISLGSGYKGNIDIFTSKGKTSFEIHVLDSRGREVGIYGPDGWFNKHGLVGRPANIPANVENACRGKAVELGRRLQVVPPKGTANIKGNNLRKYLSRLLPAKGLVFFDLAKPSPKRACQNSYSENQYNTCESIGEIE